MKCRRNRLFLSVILIPLIFGFISLSFNHGREASAGQIEDANKMKEEGDQFAREENFAKAAEAYSRALSLSSAFSDSERMNMAKVMAWGGNIDQSMNELNALLLKNPKNLEARIHLSRVMLWSGEFDAAQKEINKVLMVSPDNREALIVQANGMRFRKNYRTSISMYNELVNQKDDYEAREGLTYAYLFSNDRVTTDKSLSRLKPAFPYEEKSLNELKELRDKRFNPTLSPGLTFYHDSDDNDVWRYFLKGTAWFGNWKTNLDYIYTDAKDPNQRMLTEGVVLSTYSRMPFRGGIGGSVGFADSGRYITWNARGDIDIPYGSIGATVGEDLLSDTAGVIRNHIRVLNTDLSVVYRPTDRISLSASYGYRDYSDDNYANDVLGNASFLLYRKPAAIAIGYRFRYLDFKIQSRGGYFDPSNFISNALFVNISFENGPIYGHIEPYFGYQSFTRYEEGNNSFFGGGAGLIGYRFTKYLAAEASAEGGNYALGASGAYTYYQVGASLIILF